MDRFDLISKKIKIVTNECRQASQNANLIAVTKYSPSLDIELAYKSGHRHFGENRVDELLEKSLALSHLEGINWHFIGELQSKKIKSLLKVKNLMAIHSIDRESQLNNLLKYKSEYTGNNLNIFLQINTSGETQKGGMVDYQSLKNIAQHEAFNSTCFKLKGLMTMGAIFKSDMDIGPKESFLKLVELGNNLKGDLGINELDYSMGMSQDWEEAIDSGATWIRLGSIIFGDRIR